MICPYCGKETKPYEDHYCQYKGFWKPTLEYEGQLQVYECPKCNWLVVLDEVDQWCPNCKAELQFK
jgi:rubrerythrin